MSRRFFPILLLAPLLLMGGKKEGWDYSDTFVLKKDQIQHIRIREKSKIHRLAFSWTLHANGGLVMHVSYDGRKFQPLLYQRYRLESFRIDLFSKPDTISEKGATPPYLLLQFKAFDSKKKEAWLDLLLKGYGKNEISYVRGR